MCSICTLSTLNAQPAPSAAPATNTTPAANTAPTATPAAEPVQTSITIVEKVAAEAPASLTILDSRRVQQVPGINLDDRLRMVPGFSLFRRSSSLAAHPTTQGISLRGLGSTGASRTLVLWDGVPLNDPFGGWVYWTRVSPELTGRVEVSRGASTSLFGDRAMAGAITLFTREPERASHTRALFGSYEAGNRGTHQAEAGYANLFGRVGLTASARAFTTDGYYIVGEAFRGPVDRPATTRFVAPTARFDYLGTTQRFFAKVDMLVEERVNGTSRLRNSTSLGTLSAHYTRDWSRDGLSFTGYHSRGEFRSNFSFIPAGRLTERITANQSVPSLGSGGAAYWRHTESRWSSLAGLDLVRVSGRSLDTFYAVNGLVTRSDAGGDVFHRGFFGQFNGSAGPVKIFLGAREHFAGSGRSFFSPNAGLTTGRGPWRARFSAYRSFRAPTLNELYREFRAGNAITRANDQLQPETLTGVEFGGDYTGENGRYSLTFFRNSLDNLVGNITLSTSPTQIIRQRQNIASALARGFELDLRQRLHRRFELEGNYLFADSRVASGLRTPQVAKHYGSAQATYFADRTLVSAGLRSSAFQFDDDLNTFRLPGYAAAHLSIRHQITPVLALQAVVENLLDREILTGFTPVPAIAAPRLWRIGVRYSGRVF
ncbi:MAG: TonB-dependent receptor [Bryobacterales bacterium]|nr:TonB-dependent receptor [Bryobacterales bacterium]